MQVGQGDSGMVTMNQSLLSLVQLGQISVEDAYAHSGDTDELRTMVEGKAGKRAPAAKPSYR